MKLKDQAVSTSGGYERYIEINEEKYSHIIDPKTGEMIKAKGAVTVVSDKAVWADIYSTAAFANRELIKQIDLAIEYGE